MASDPEAREKAMKGVEAIFERYEFPSYIFVHPFLTPPSSSTLIFQLSSHLPSLPPIPSLNLSPFPSFLSTRNHN